MSLDVSLKPSANSNEAVPETKHDYIEDKKVDATNKNDGRISVLSKNSAASSYRRASTVEIMKRYGISEQQKEKILN